MEVARTLIDARTGLGVAGGCDDARYQWRNVQIAGGGYVPGIVFSEAERGLIYARTDIGGAYRWDGATARWVR